MSVIYPGPIDPRLALAHALSQRQQLPQPGGSHNDAQAQAHSIQQMMQQLAAHLASQRQPLGKARVAPRPQFPQFGPNGENYTNAIQQILTMPPSQSAPGDWSFNGPEISVAPQLRQGFRPVPGVNYAG